MARLIVTDIDLAVVSPDLGKKNEIKEMAYLLQRAHQIELDIEAHPYHLTELKNPEKGTLAYEILKTGKLIFP